MNKLLELYDRIEKSNIYLEKISIPSYKATTIEINYNYGIFIDYDKIIDNSEKFTVIAHEYGHCISGATHKINSPFEIIAQHEYRADRASIHKLLPVDNLIAAFDNGYTELWQLAEYLDLPEQFVKKAIEIYKNEEKL